MRYSESVRTPKIGDMHISQPVSLRVGSKIVDRGRVRGDEQTELYNYCKL